MGWEYSDVFRFDLGLVLQSKMRVCKLKGAYISLIIAARGLECETNK